jgi:hypothetical protein
MHAWSGHRKVRTMTEKKRGLTSFVAPRFQELRPRDEMGRKKQLEQYYDASYMNKRFELLASSSYSIFRVSLFLEATEARNGMWNLTTRRCSWVPWCYSTCRCEPRQ